MNIVKIERAFKFKHPGRDIIMIPPENPTEIICEVEPTSEHPEYSVALVAIDSSEPHYHKLSTETYTVLKGALALKLSRKEVLLYPGISYVVPPNTVHSAEGDRTIGDITIVEVTSRPGWTPEDHILVEQAN
jgi:mannose-6-phosphate isomerase-like protein (cupin superfamily)